MRKLEPLIARFVHDVLHALRGATLDELSDLFSEARPSVRAPRPPARSPRPTAARPQEPPRLRRRAERVPARAPRVRVAESTVKSLARSIIADITDPERLLTATTHAAFHPPASTPAVHEDEPSPPSGERPSMAATWSLRAGETLVRASGSGVVIRRAKRG